MADLKIIKDAVEKDEISGVDKEELKELKKLEKLEQQEAQNKEEI